MAQKPIDTGSIEGYDGMTPEQKVAALEAFTYEDNAEEMERLKIAVSKANKESAERKQKLSDMQTEEQRRQQEMEEKIQKLEEDAKLAREERTLAAHKASLLANGYEESLAGEGADALMKGDMVRFFAIQKKAHAALEKEITKKLLGQTTPPPAGGIGEQVEDYDKLIADAQARSDWATAAYYTRLKEESRIKKNT